MPVDITKKALWEVSSVKMGTSVGQIIDDCTETFWQSNRWGPHCITARFNKTYNVKMIRINLSAKMDETYTPKKIIARIGQDMNSLTAVAQFDLVEPNGWIDLPLSPTDFVKSVIHTASNKDVQASNGCHSSSSHATTGIFKTQISNLSDMTLPIKLPEYFRCSVVQVVILSNFQSGQDSHVRQIQIISE